MHATQKQKQMLHLDVLYFALSMWLFIILFKWFVFSSF